MKKASVIVMATIISTGAGLSSGAAQGADQPASEEGVNLCVELREKIYQCKDEFAEAFVAHHNPPPAERAAMKAKALEEITADGSGPLPPRRQVCAEMAKRGTKMPPDFLKNLKKGLADCSAKPDCQAKVACLMPLIKPGVGKGMTVKR